MVHVKNTSIILLSETNNSRLVRLLNIVEEQLQHDISNMIYLPSINQAPTELSAIVEIIKQVKTKSERVVYLTEVDLVAHHAI